MNEDLINSIGLWSMTRQRDVTDDIGDCLVVLNTIAIMFDTTLEDCLNVAYNDIKDRKGHMNSEGIFIKEGDVA